MGNVRLHKTTGTAQHIDLPHLGVLAEHGQLVPNKLAEVVRDALVASSEEPCYVEARFADEQRYLFFRERQIYAAGCLADGQLTNTPIKDFLLAAGKSPTPDITCYRANSKILHSLLILFQKKATLKLLSSLVDLDAVLDKIESERKSCIVSASQDSFLAVLRYEKGQVTALCHKLSSTSPQEQSFREDFLVRIYTLSAEQPLHISVFEDLLVQYAADARMIDDAFDGNVVDLYLSKPPIATLFFKGKTVGHWLLDKPAVNIGRTEDNDIPIDNLAVSRLHAVIERDKGETYIRDCDSLNGTLLNGRRVGRAKLQPGDELTIGKHVLRIQHQTGIELAPQSQDVPFDQTVVISPEQHAARDRPTPGASEVPRLVEKNGDVVIELSKPLVVLGKDEQADVLVGGFLVARKHAEIIHDAEGFRLKHVHGLRRVCVGGKAVKECRLKDQDEIKIGNREFIFQE